MMDARLRKQFDIPLLVLTFIIAAIGVMVIYSATHDDSHSAFHKKQMLWIAAGSVAMVLLSLLDYHVFGRVTGYLYILNLAPLAIVLKKGATTVNGAARWISMGPFQFQPSEFAKVILILALAVYLTHNSDKIREWKTLLLSLLYVALPCALIFKQPDLGTALVIFAIWFVLTYMCGANLAHLAILAGTALLLFGIMWQLNVIKPYQKQRLVSFTNPELYKNETGYHVYQARIAVGSGGMWGKGFLHSTQVRGGYIPERQTDFIFTDVGEEWGFAGSVTLVALYLALLLRGTAIVAASDEDMLGKLIAAGVVTMFAFHIVVNIGMNIGIMPVTGVPLLLLSYGGSNMIVALACIGLLQSVSLHRHQLLF